MHLFRFNRTVSYLRGTVDDRVGQYFDPPMSFRLIAYIRDVQTTAHGPSEVQNPKVFLVHNRVLLCISNYELTLF